MTIAADPVRVVVVDDSEDLRGLIRRLLDREDDFTVVGEAADGQAGVDTTDAQQPDVVLLDIAMPVLDGLQALPLIRKKSPASVVVVLSGFGTDSRAAQKALELGAHGFLNKGDTQGKLVERLRVILQSHRARATWAAPARAPKA
ncbi:MAG: response regulator [Marmoricola sp.]|nr:response regulator [Marmoricola sp.]